jgi:hypothetical protein
MSVKSELLPIDPLNKVAESTVGGILQSVRLGLSLNKLACEGSSEDR